MYQVYILVCPLTKFVVYVGVTELPFEQRLSNHITDRCNREKALWIDRIKSYGYLPEIRLAEKCNSRNEMLCIESWWIKELLKLGCRLLNKRHNYNTRTLKISTGRHKIKKKIVSSWYDFIIDGDFEKLSSILKIHPQEVRNLINREMATDRQIKSINNYFNKRKAHNL